MKSKKSKILFLIQLPPPIHGQSTMNKYINNSTVINNKYKTKYINISPALSLSDIGKISTIKLFTTISIIVKSFKELLLFRPKITYLTLSHIGIAFYKDAILVILSKLFSSSSIILHLHGKGIEKEVQKSIFKKWYYKLIFKNTFVIITAENLKDDIKNIYFKEPYIVPNGIEINVHYDKKPSNNKPKILFLSNLLKEKGIYIFFDVLEKLMANNMSFEAIVVGQYVHIDHEEIQNIIIQKKLSDYIKLLSAKYGTEKDDILYNSDIILFPSFTEAFPLVLLEAMKFGVCIVANSVGGIPNMVDTKVNGYLVNDNNIDEYVKILSSLIIDKNHIHEIGENAREKFKAQYTIENFENNLIATFEDVFHKRKKTTIYH